MPHAKNLQQQSVQHNKLEQFLITEIRRAGPMNFAIFMEHALTHSEFGYYRTRDPLGKEGDFTTAPEISQMFGEIIGAWVADVWMKMDSPEKFYLLEVGPGRGTLMSDMLRVCMKIEGFQKAAEIYMMEISPVLQGKQREKLAGYDIEWIERIENAPHDAPMIIVGNEFLDTIPVHQVYHMPEGWRERAVDVNAEGNLVYSLMPILENLIPYLPRYPKPEELYEISPMRVEYGRRWAEMIKRHRGAVLQIDYGHAMTLSGQTLRGFQGHKHVDILQDVGLSDVTSDVDFEAMGRAVMAMGLSLMPVVRQGEFLKALGIEMRAARLREKDAGVDAALKRLTEEGGDMGRLFKVFCFHYGLSAPPEGFF